jgi:hypothetical protein
MKIAIKKIFSCDVLFENTEGNNSRRLTLEKAVRVKANLTGAHLAGEYLSGAMLDGAKLKGAYIKETVLDGCSLRAADLARADLTRAILAGADFTNTNFTDAILAQADIARADFKNARLSGAILDAGERLVGSRPIFQIGPLGSRSDYLIAYLTDRGLRLRTGCFFGSREEFDEKLKKTHENNDYAKDYRAALRLIDAHAGIWMPKEQI